MEIEKIVHRQASIGLKLATDGEFRRSWWHFDFLANLDRLRDVSSRTGHPVRRRPDPARARPRRSASSISRRPSDARAFQVPEEAGRRAHVTPKMTIPSPAVLHFRGGRKAISKEVYPDIDAFFEDLGKTYRKAVKAFYDAGCRYLQFDDTVWAYLCSKEELEKARARGDDVDSLPADLCPHDQLRDRRAARRHDDHDPCLPRQFPLDLDFVRRLRAGGRDAARRHQLRRLFPGI